MALWDRKVFGLLRNWPQVLITIDFGDFRAVKCNSTRVTTKSSLGLWGQQAYCLRRHSLPLHTSAQHAFFVVGICQPSCLEQIRIQLSPFPPSLSFFTDLPLWWVPGSLGVGAHGADGGADFPAMGSGCQKWKPLDIPATQPQLQAMQTTKICNILRISYLCLHIITCHNISHCSKSSWNNMGKVVPDKTNKNKDIYTVEPS